MRENAELLEELQETYACHYDLTIMVTDESGEAVTPIKGKNSLCNKLFAQKHENLMGKIKESLNDIRTISSPITHDLIPGIHMIVVPLEIPGGNKAFLWSGVFVEENGRQFVIEKLNQHVNEGVSWECVIDETPVLTSGNKKEWLNLVSKLAKIISLCFDREKASFDFNSFLLQQAVNNKTEGIIEKLVAHHHDHDFLGIAEKVDGEEYRVTHIAGEGAASLRGAPFFLGEGFLGRVLISGKAGYWEDIKRDPRSYFFHRFSLSPGALFCYPIKRYDGSLSLLFGGSLSNGEIPKGSLDLGKALANVLEMKLLTENLQKENSEQLNRLSSLVEICKLMASTPETKRILYILVDISLNLVEGPFSCVVLKDKDDEKAQIVARGDMTDQAKDYVKDVVNRYYRQSSKDTSDDSLPKENVTPWGGTVIECPLFNRGELLGVLCVGVEQLSAQQLKEHITFLHTLGIIGGISLHLAKVENEGTTSGQVETLHKAIGQFDEEAYMTARESGKLASEFALKLGLPAPIIKDIISACQLHFYTGSFLEQFFPDSRVPWIVEEGKMLIGKPLQEWEEANICSQVFAIVFMYERKRSIELFERGEAAIFQDFISFIKETHVMEQEISLSDDLEEPELTSFSDTIKEQANLSPREQEVLNLVIQGLNNREIAEELYISGHTVKNHVTKIFQKLDVPDRAHAISKVYQLKYAHS
ncbi:regulatory protein, luxR family [Halobacillus dabanensis]|uniref:Regulatory protein, luxR family n=1 Tax=Halobacillus dabanensis TaxID=240302 RepID=A0A1I3WEW6_HALDA|nr:helix-turn-helix transcriptional regulator [Halobacillus dabanensis]SFK04981.1 regulatory protein, luxR family [Halobacillus dabanensis]